MSRTAEEGDSWLKASCCRDEDEGTRTALPEKKDPNPRKFSTGLQWHACSRLQNVGYPQGTSFAGNLVTLVEKRCDVARKVTFVCFHMIFRHRQQTEMGECWI